MKKLVLFVFLCTATSISFSKVLSVKIGVNGLTCSQCTRNVEMQLRKLSFIKDVEMNLANTEGLITFKDGEQVNFHKIAQAVIDAGFSVRYLTAEIKIENESLTKPDLCYTIDNNLFSFIDFKEAGNGATIKVLFVGKEYQEKKEYHKWKNKIKTPCQKAANKEIYSVTMA